MASYSLWNDCTPDDELEEADEPEGCDCCGHPSCDGECDGYVLSVQEDAADNASEQDA